MRPDKFVLCTIAKVSIVTFKAIKIIIIGKSITIDPTIHTLHFDEALLFSKI